MPRGPRLASRAITPYFILAGLIHAAAVATRFDALAAFLPARAPDAILFAQFPLLFLSGYLESRIDHGPSMKDFPVWMRIRSFPVKFAFTFAFIYLTCVVLQHWDLSIGPVDPTPPDVWPTWHRAMWFAMFTGGFFFIYYLAAAGLLIPVLRVLVWPLWPLPVAVGVVLALILGVGAGVGVLALMTSDRVSALMLWVSEAGEDGGLFTILSTLAVILLPFLMTVRIRKRTRD